MNAVATIEPQRQSLIATMATRYSMEPKAFADTLRQTVVPKNATDAEFAAFLIVAKEYDLNPITKEIYAFPKQGGGIQPIVSVDGWANLINSHPKCDGVEFEDHLDGEKLVSITCRIYRKDRSRPTTATEYMVECRRDTQTWKQWPRRMLRHKALIQAARYAFGFAGIVDPDEADRDPTVRELAPPSPSAPRLAPPSPSEPAVRGETVARVASEPHQRSDMSDSPLAPSESLASRDPEAWIAECESRMAECASVEALRELWECVIAPESDDAFPPDVAEVRKAFARHEERLSDA